MDDVQNNNDHADEYVYQSASKNSIAGTNDSGKSVSKKWDKGNKAAKKPHRQMSEKNWFL